MSRLDELLRQAQDATPDELHPARVERAVAEAAVTGRARHRGWVLRRVSAVAGVSAALAAAAATVWMLTPAAPAAPLASTPDVPAVESSEAPADDHAAVEGAETQRAEGPTHLELDTGDRLLATAGARFSVERATRRERLIELGAGTMLFDVQPLDGGRFTVLTSDARVVVRGTVFTVEADRRGTTVRVYEGRVDVHETDGVRSIRAGESARIGRGAPSRRDPLAVPAAEAAARRGVEASTTDPSATDPSATDPSATDPSATDPSAHEPSAHEPRTAPTADVGPLATRERPARPRPATEPATEPVEATPAGPTPLEVRRWIASGPEGAERALAAVQARLATGAHDPWRMLEADALRAAHRPTEAAASYALAVRECASPRREQAGYLAARLLSSSAPAEALRRLDEAGVTEPGSPLRERGLALRVDLLGRLGQARDQESVARAYLALYPDGSRAGQMRRLVEP